MFEPKPVADFRRAAFHLFLLAGLYATHSIYAFGVLSSKSKDPVGEFFGVLVCAAFLFLLLWAARVVWRGGRLVGAIVLTAFLLLASALSTVMAFRIFWPSHPVFEALQVLMLGTSVKTLVLLGRAGVRRSLSPEG